MVHSSTIREQDNDTNQLATPDLVALHKAASEGDPQACWQLGTMLARSRDEAAMESAWDWLIQAAQHDHPGALDSLLELDMLQGGTPQRRENLQSMRDNFGLVPFPSINWNIAYHLAHEANASAYQWEKAGQLLKYNLALGHAQSYFFLSQLPLESTELRDALLLRASDAGVYLASYIKANWPADRLAQSNAAYAALKQWFADNRPLREQLASAHDDVTANRIGEQLLSSLNQLEEETSCASLFANIVPSRPTSASSRTVSESPQVIVIDNALDIVDCAYLIHLVSAELALPESYRTGHAYADALLFTGQGLDMLQAESNLVSARFMHDIADRMGVSVSQFEPGSIIRYQHEEKYEPHIDAFNEAQLQHNEQVLGDPGGQRTHTVLGCLLAPEVGGQTEYPAAGLKLSWQDGQGLVHRNVTEDGAADPKSLHSGLPVVQGEKWLMRHAIREYPCVPPLPPL